MPFPSPILVTGAAGFIGSHLAETLLKQGRRVIGVDDLNPYYAPPVKKFNLSLLRKYPDFCFIEGDILDQGLVFQILKEEKPDFLIHCAARAGVRESVKNPLVYTKVNVLGTQVLLEAIRLHSPEMRSVLFSSSSVYGLQDEVPFQEEMRANPRSPYSLSKYLMEQAAAFYHHFYGLRMAVVRPFSIYGPRGRPDMAPFLLIKAAEEGRPFVKYGTDKDNRRDWTYIDDFVEGILKLMDKFDFSSFEVFNLGKGHPVGIDEFVAQGSKLIKRYLGEELVVTGARRGEEELPITYADISKAKTKFGYRPRVPLRRGLERLLQFYAKHRDLYGWCAMNKEL